MPVADPLTQIERQLDLPCDIGDLATAGAKALCGWLGDDRVFDARFVSARKSSTMTAELVIAEVDVELGQRPPVNPIRSTEVIGFLFEDSEVPQAYPLRADFPIDLPHVNLAPVGLPRSLCLFEIASEELLRILTPVLLIERTRFWLTNAAHNKLHGDEQPLDPIFAGRATPVILPPPMQGGGHHGLIAFAMSDHPGRPIVVDFPSRLRNTDGLLPLSYLAIETQAVPHGRLRALPRNLRELVEIYEELGIDLPGCIGEGMAPWLEANAVEHFGRKLLLIISTPIERRPSEIGGIASKGFLFQQAALEAAEALGLVRSGGGMIAKPLSNIPIDPAAMERIGVEPADVHRPFGRSLAAVASGFTPTKKARDITMIGAGALGSQIALTAARGGHGRWTIVDPDHVMPHNLARHALLAEHVGWPKAEAVATEIICLLNAEAATPVVATAEQHISATEGEVSGTVIDVSASVPVSRHLAASDKITEPVASVFVSPSGSDLVFLREGNDRSPRLDHVEMDYYWGLATNPELTDHLASADAFLPSGGCRHPSVQIPQSRLMRAAANAVDHLFEYGDASHPEIKLYLANDGGQDEFELAANEYREFELAGWTIAISEAVIVGLIEARENAAPCETGGIVVGAWDRSRKKGWIVALLDPPPDSERSPTHFVRGSMGVFRTLSHIERTTASNLSYLGEWHTHPPGHQSEPSEDDRLLMNWIGEAVTYSDVPPVMLIGGEDGIRLMLGTTQTNCLIDG